ncbi:hypothetical protein Pse7367_1844 [Thalassoporum mexicanum PCC 7367]|nr:hypothetical protein Pse7367_1844 [Pseudanabaena sp. PCC 7367]
MHMHKRLQELAKYHSQSDATLQIAKILSSYLYGLYIEILATY